MIEVVFINGNRTKIRKSEFAPVNLVAWENKDGMLELLLNKGMVVVNLAEVSMIRNVRPPTEDDD